VFRVSRRHVGLGGTAKWPVEVVAMLDVVDDDLFQFVVDAVEDR
jgi:hypothetical protein